jgi:hypothetical protein
MRAALPLLALLAASLPAAATGPVALAQHVTVHSDRVDLAALLPPSAPDWLRERARQIDLGPAPRPGWRRQLLAADLERQLPADLAAVVRIPAVVTVECTAEPLRREEIVDAIRQQLRGRFGWLAELLPTLPVEFPALTVGTPHRLELRAVRYDTALACAVFDLRLTSASGVQHFAVIARLPAGHARELTLLDRSAERSGALWSARANRNRTHQLPVLVRPGRPVALVLLGPQIEVVTRAVPLERGSAGQIIRARLKTTRRIIQARVAAGGWLEARIL